MEKFQAAESPVCGLLHQVSFLRAGPQCRPGPLGICVAPLDAPNPGGARAWRLGCAQGCVVGDDGCVAPGVVPATWRAESGKTCAMHWEWHPESVTDSRCAGSGSRSRWLCRGAPWRARETLWAGRGGPPSPVAAGTAGGGRGFAFVRRTVQAAAGPCRTRARRTSRASRWVPRAGRGWGRCRRRAPRGAAGERGAGTPRCGQTKSRRPSRCPGPAGDPGLGRAAARRAQSQPEPLRRPVPGGTRCPGTARGRAWSRPAASRRADSPAGAVTTRRPGRRPARQAHGPGGAGVAGGERAPAAVPPARAAGGRCWGAAGPGARVRRGRRSPGARAGRAAGAAAGGARSRGARAGTRSSPSRSPASGAARRPHLPGPGPAPQRAARARLTRLGRRGGERRSPGALLTSPALRPAPSSAGRGRGPRALPEDAARGFLLGKPSRLSSR